MARRIWLWLALFAFGAVAAAAEPQAYKCLGFDEPLNHGPMQIGKGRVLPLRAKLAAPDGSFGDNNNLKSSPAVRLVFLPESGPEEDKTAGLEVRDYGKGNRFVFDQEAHWKFDLGTGNLEKEGRYKVTLVSGDEKEYRVDAPCTLEFTLHGGK